ncbi:MAG: hypothetical protein IT378_12540 [Sandaracinaceae bacterium]|nr:hypothetical protein [Sandaracinaceae bacterium]
MLLPALPIDAHVAAELGTPEDAAGRVVFRGHGARAAVAFCDRRARALGVRPGQSLASARARAAGLIAAPFDAGSLERRTLEAIARLLRVTPRIAPDGPGRFWVEPLDNETWIDDLRSAIAELGPARVGVGPFACAAFAAARLDAGRVAEPRALLGSQGLEVLELGKPARRALASLGVRRVGALLALRPSELGARLGPEVAAAWHRASGADPRGPTTPRLPDAPEVAIELEDPITDLEPLLFVLRAASERLLARARARGEGIAGASVSLDAHVVRLRASHPIGDATTLSTLIRAHLERETLAAPVDRIGLRAEAHGPLGSRTGSLWPHERARDPAAHAVALERLRNRFGAGAVARAEPVPAESALSRARWTELAPERRGAALPWRAARAKVHTGRVTLAGRERRIVRIGIVEQAIAPWWETGSLVTERLAWAELEGPLLALLRAGEGCWEVVAWID